MIGHYSEKISQPAPEEQHLGNTDYHSPIFSFGMPPIGGIHLPEYLYFYMANTYTQIHIQLVFAVKNRAALILPEWEDELYRFIIGIIQNNDHKVLAINGMPDHIHIFFGYRVSQSIPNLVELIKTKSSQFIREQGFTPSKFSWQNGYGAFSYSKSHVDRVVKYVLNQKQHHRKKTFRQEYEQLLRLFEVEYKPEYLFDFGD